MVTRVSSQSHFDRLQYDVQRTQERSVELQTQISSGKKSSNYAGLGIKGADMAAFRATQNRLTQFKNNIDTADRQITTTEKNIEQILKAIGDFRANLVTTVSANNYAQYPYSTEAQQVLEQISGFLNVRDSDGRYLMAGSMTNTAPVSLTTPVPATDPTIPLTTTPNTPYYSGDTVDAFTVRADDNQVLNYSVRADNPAFETAIRALQSVINPVLGPTVTNTLDVLNSAIELLSSAGDGMNTIVGNLGNTGRTLDNFKAKHTDMLEILRGSISNIDDADVLSATSELSHLDTSLQASYYLIAQIRNNSLVNRLN
jgi:flagellar hook-associated protein 3 FlgL